MVADGLEQAMPHRQNQKKRSRARAERWWAQLRLFQLAAIDQTERLWQVICKEKIKTTKTIIFKNM